MKKYLLLIFILLIFFGLSAQQSADEMFTRSEELFNAGKYQEAIEIFEEIIKANNQPIQIMNAKLGILKCSYYDWDLKKAVRLGNELLKVDIQPESADYHNRFYTYWWLINTYKALKDKKNSYLMQKELVNFYEINRDKLDKKCEKIYSKVLKKIQ